MIDMNMFIVDQNAYLFDAKCSAEFYYSRDDEVFRYMVEVLNHDDFIVQCAVDMLYTWF